MNLLEINRSIREFREAKEVSKGMITDSLWDGKRLREIKWEILMEGKWMKNKERKIHGKGIDWEHRKLNEDRILLIKK